jgi:hypothetical protein
MLKSIVGVVVGYIVMFIFASVVFAGAYFGLGVDRVFESGSYAVSTLWIALMIAIALIGGILGGLTCAAISKSYTACVVFAALVFALGLIMGLPNALKEHPTTVRSDDVPNFQAMQLAQAPVWLCFLNPALGAVGVLLGGRRKKNPAA